MMTIDPRDDRRSTRRSGKRVLLVPHARREDIGVGVRALICDAADVEHSRVGERADAERLPATSSTGIQTRESQPSHGRGRS